MTYSRRACASRRLYLNAAKIELICFGSQAALQQSVPSDRTFTISVSDVVLLLQPTDVRVLLDSEQRAA